jgi:hypothetical protein
LLAYPQAEKEAPQGQRLDSSYLARVQEGVRGRKENQGPR